MDGRGGGGHEAKVESLEYVARERETRMSELQAKNTRLETRNAELQLLLDKANNRPTSVLLSVWCWWGRVHVCVGGGDSKRGGAGPHIIRCRMNLCEEVCLEWREIARRVDAAGEDGRVGRHGRVSRHVIARS